MNLDKVGEAARAAFDADLPPGMAAPKVAENVAVFRSGGKGRVDQPSGQSGDDDSIEVTEDGVAREFTRIHGGTLRFDHDTGHWYEWTGDHWRQDGHQRALHLCRMLARAATVGAKGSALATARKSGFAAGVERFARADPVHAVRQDVWDQDPWLLGIPGGELDCRTGKVLPPDPSHGITRQAAVAPAQFESCPLWLRFLEDATGADDGMIRFLQMFLGMCLTGITREHILIFIFGGGGNGKSVLLNTAAGILHEYAATAAMETFTASSNDRHPTELAVLRGVRLVTASETEEGRAIAEARVKQMTGGDNITARLMRQDSFTFKPQFKLLITGNHRPTLKNVDDAARRRFNIVPFTRKPVAPNENLETDLKAEWPGILRWMINGALDWQENGLIRPASITQATDAYFTGQDHFGQWLEEDCTVRLGDLTSWETSRVLFENWSAFARAAGVEPGNTTRFGENMGRRGFIRAEKKVERKATKVWCGVALQHNGWVNDK